MAGKANLKINQGETFKHVFTWNGSNGTPIDLTGCSAKMHVRSSPAAETTLLTFSSDELDAPDGSITLGGVDGTISLKLSHTISSTINWVSGVYDLEVTDSLNDVTRVVEGSVSVSKEVTR